MKTSYDSHHCHEDGSGGGGSSSSSSSINAGNKYFL